MNVARGPTATRRGRGRLAVVGAGALVAPLAAFGLVPRASPPAPPTPAQRVQAIAAPSIAYVGVQWRGWVLMPPAIRAVDGTAIPRGRHGPFTVNTACSGFVADPAGYIVTAGHCVDDQSMIHGGKAAIIDALIQGVRASFPAMTPDQLEIIRTAVEENGRVEDRASGSPPQRRVTVYPAGIAFADGLAAAVVDYRGLTEGDVALLKVTAQAPLPTLAVAPTSPPVGTPILLAGYVASVSRIVDPGQEPSFKDGATSSHQTINGVPFTEVSAAAEAGMSGGPALDLQARVVGTASFRPGSEAAAFTFITGASTVRSLMARNAVGNVLTAADRAYRAGLDAYFAGHYHDAAMSFDDVLAVQPENTGAQHYRQLAIANDGNAAETGGGNAGLLVAAAAAVLLVVAVLLLRGRRTGGAHAGPRTPVTAPTLPPNEPAAQPQPPVETAPTSVAVNRAATVEPTQPAPVAPPIAPAGYCSNCGTPHDAEANFCEVCGARVRVAAAAARERWNGYS